MFICRYRITSLLEKVEKRYMTVRRTPATALNQLRGKDRRLVSVVGAQRMRVVLHPSPRSAAPQARRLIHPRRGMELYLNRTVKRIPKV